MSRRVTSSLSALITTAALATTPGSAGASILYMATAPAPYVIYRIDTTAHTATPVYTYDEGTSTTIAIAIDDDGDTLYLIDMMNKNAYRVDLSVTPPTETLLGDLINGGGAPITISVPQLDIGPDGRLWFVAANGRDDLLSFDPVTDCDGVTCTTTLERDLNGQEGIDAAGADLAIADDGAIYILSNPDSKLYRGNIYNLGAGFSVAGFVTDHGDPFYQGMSFDSDNKLIAANTNDHLYLLPIHILPSFATTDVVDLGTLSVGGVTLDIQGGDLGGFDYVELLQLAAARAGAGVVLSWTTGVEINCGRFEVRACDLSGGACRATDHRTVGGAAAQLPCQDSREGASYRTTLGGLDEAAAWSFQLVEYETRGGVQVYGPLHLPAGAPEAAWNPETGVSSVRDVPELTPPAEVGGGCASASPADGFAVFVLAAALALVARRRNA